MNNTEPRPRTVSSRGTGTLGQIRPRDCCQHFEMRSSGAPLEAACWYCRYAYFGLERARPLKNGECRWPEKQIV